MIFDVIVREGMTTDGKDIYKVERVRDSMLSKFVRETQNAGKYVFAIIPLFRKKKEDEDASQIV